MFAMMLPSGNDAAQTLAIYFGNMCLLNERKGTGSRISMVYDANINELDYPEEETESENEEETNSCNAGN